MGDASSFLLGEARKTAAQPDGAVNSFLHYSVLSRQVNLQLQAQA